MQLTIDFDTRPPAAPTDTSAAAAEQIRPQLTELRRRVLGAITAAGDAGATDQELAARLGLSGDTLRPRRIELVNAGLVADSGIRRRTPSGRQAIAWIAIDY